MTDNKKSKEEYSKELKNGWIEDQPYVFVSYASSDWEKVYPIIIELRNRGFNVYIDTELEEVATRNWLEQIHNRIFEAKNRGIISFLSINYMRSYACMYELLLNQSQELKDDRGESLPVFYISLDENMTTPQKIRDYIRKEDIRDESQSMRTEMQRDESDLLTDVICDCGIFEEKQEASVEVKKIKNKHNVATRMDKYCFQNKSINIQLYIDVKHCVDMLEGNFINTKNNDINLKPLKELMSATEETSHNDINPKPLKELMPATEETSHDDINTRPLKELMPATEETCHNEERTTNLQQSYTGKSSSVSKTAVTERQLSFWKEFQEYCNGKGKNYIANGKYYETGPNWYSVSIGGKKFHIEYNMDTKNSQMALVIYVETPEAFDRLESKKDIIEATFGNKLEWYLSKKDAKAKRIIYKQECDIFNTSEQEEYFSWMVEKFDALRAALVQAGEVQ